MELTIYKNRPFSADFVVISNDGVTPEALAPTDSATVDVIREDDVSKTVLSGVPLVILNDANAINGTFTLTLTAEQTNLLEVEKMLREDRFEGLANHTLYLVFNVGGTPRYARVAVKVQDSGN